MPGAILVVGSLNMDMVVRTERHPQPGETVLGSNFQTFPGGKGANQAVAAARAGGLVKMIGRIGEDAFGAALQSSLVASGVDTTHLHKTPGEASGVALITLDAEGQNTIVVASGANGLLTPDDIIASEAAFVDAAVVLLQLETPLETVCKAVEMAHKYSAQVLLNPSPAPSRSLPTALVQQIDYLIPNEHELSLIAGIQPLSPAIDAILSLGSGAVIVTLGSNGVIVAEDGKSVHLNAHTVPVVDTVAAGDAFVGAFAVALAEGKPLLEAAAWGNASGAIAVTRSGAQPSLPWRAEIEAFLAKNQA